MGGFIRKIFKIERPFQQPIVEEVPAYEEPEREEVVEELTKEEKRRKGRRLLFYWTSLNSN